MFKRTKVSSVGIFHSGKSVGTFHISHFLPPQIFTLEATFQHHFANFREMHILYSLTTYPALATAGSFCYNKSVDFIKGTKHKLNHLTFPTIPHSEFTLFGSFVYLTPIYILYLYYFNHIRCGNPMQNRGRARQSVRSIQRYPKVCSVVGVN